MICQRCNEVPAADACRIWQPIGAGAALRWHRLDVCEHCYNFAMSNTIKYGYPKGRTYERVCIGLGGQDRETPIYEQVEL